MEVAASPVGVATASPTPAPGWTAETRWPASPPAPAVALLSAEPPVWTCSTQVTMALLLAFALGLLGWHAYGSRQAACRPVELDPDVVRCARVDLNRADHVQLVQLPGVGENLARRIEDYRLEHGGFRDVDELRKVSGVGPALLDRLRPFVEVEPTDSGWTAAEPPRSGAAPQPARGKKDKPGGGRVDVNAATAAELQMLPGIGPKLSQAIVEARAQRPFGSVEDLRRVRGIGAKSLARLRPQITVGDLPAAGAK